MKIRNAALATNLNKTCLSAKCTKIERKIMKAKSKY